MDIPTTAIISALAIAIMFGLLVHARMRERAAMCAMIRREMLQRAVSGNTGARPVTTSILPDWKQKPGVSR